MHTAAFRDAPGVDGKCFPKDISALIAYCKSIGVSSTLLDAIVERERGGYSIIPPLSITPITKNQN